MKNYQTNYPLRLDEQLMEKLKVVSSKNSRSVNKQIEFLVTQCVEQFEKDNGIITTELDN